MYAFQTKTALHLVRNSAELDLQKGAEDRRRGSIQIDAVTGRCTCHDVTLTNEQVESLAVLRHTGGPERKCEMRGAGRQAFEQRAAIPVLIEDRDAAAV